jgi:hypothetical protein
MMHYTLMAFAAEASEPASETILADHDAAALDKVRGLLRAARQVRQVEVWRGDRRIATVERVV